MTAISTQTTEALRQAALLVERDQALAALVGVLDPERSMSLWALAGTITRMQTTHAVAINRIEAGARPVRDDIEAALLTLRRTGCPSSQRRCFALLQDLLGD